MVVFGGAITPTLSAPGVAPTLSAPPTAVLVLLQCTVHIFGGICTVYLVVLVILYFRKTKTRAMRCLENIATSLYLHILFACSFLCSSVQQRSKNLVVEILYNVLVYN